MKEREKRPLGFFFFVFLFSTFWHQALYPTLPILQEILLPFPSPPERLFCLGLGFIKGLRFLLPSLERKGTSSSAPPPHTHSRGAIFPLLSAPHPPPPSPISSVIQNKKSVNEAAGIERKRKEERTRGGNKERQTSTAAADTAPFCFLRLLLLPKRSFNVFSFFASFLNSSFTKIGRERRERRK